MAPPPTPLVEIKSGASDCRARYDAPKGLQQLSCRSCWARLRVTDHERAAAGSHCSCVRRALLRLRHLTAFIVTRNHWRDEMIKRGVARYNWQTGKWEWGEPPKEPKSWEVR
jgi:hypothetical protein